MGGTTHTYIHTYITYMSYLQNKGFDKLFKFKYFLGAICNEK